MHIAFDEAELNPEPVELEEGDEYYLDLFQSISALRLSSTGGLNPIQPDQITAWANLLGSSLTRSEARLILDIDVRFRAAVNREYERNRPKT